MIVILGEELIFLIFRLTKKSGRMERAKNMSVFFGARLNFDIHILKGKRSYVLLSFGN